ncbi:zinc finger and BTB domain-containing protein 12, partial [Pezoporus wallicus]|uniref:zinc finger and BTB domain-containing protein 12 n=1 Tax=Pezoporus wallicus TaxID=35540 RepID=UPI0025517132
MSSCAELLRFHLPGHEAAALRSITRLRAEERFCDVTIVARSLRFRGHRVILAACSPFLRDQFLLHPGAELRVSLAHSARVLADLLLSCYTGALQFRGRELVNYLTAASYLQMEHVVERCRGALARFIAAAPPAKPEEDDEEEDDDDGDGDNDGDVCIVKVEPAPRRRHRWARRGGGGGGGGGGGAVGVVKARYSLAGEGDGDGVVIFPGSTASMGASTASMGASTASMGASMGASMASTSASLGAPAGSTAPISAPPTASPPSPLPARCSKCSEAFHGVEKLVFHMRAQHLVFMCPRCGKQFNLDMG